jgi:hypothetical protein
MFSLADREDMPRRIGPRREVFTLDTFQPFDTTIGQQQGYGQAPKSP